MKRHGLSKTPEYLAWKAMLWRCNPKNLTKKRNYQDKGIGVFEGWKASFVDFLGHIGPMPTPGLEVDRKDNSRGYEPGNVKWATRGEQMANTSRALRITINEETLCASEWSRRSGIPLCTLTYRVKRKWPESELLSRDTRARHVAAGKAAAAARWGA